MVKGIIKDKDNSGYRIIYRRGIIQNRESSRHDGRTAGEEFPWSGEIKDRTAEIGGGVKPIIGYQTSYYGRFRRPL